MTIESHRVAIREWIGLAPLLRSDNLKIAPADKMRMALAGTWGQWVPVKDEPDDG